MSATAVDDVRARLAGLDELIVVTPALIDAARAGG